MVCGLQSARQLQLRKPETVARDREEQQPARQLVADIDVSPSRISEVVNGQRPITADTALRLGLFFSMEPRFWLNLQTEYDMRVAASAGYDKIVSRIRVFQLPTQA